MKKILSALFVAMIALSGASAQAATILSATGKNTYDATVYADDYSAFGFSASLANNMLATFTYTLTSGAIQSGLFSVKGNDLLVSSDLTQNVSSVKKAYTDGSLAVEAEWTKGLTGGGSGWFTVLNNTGAAIPMSMIFSAIVDGSSQLVVHGDITATPLPAAIGLFGVSVAGMAAYRRRKAA